jgi:hypothetical protein
MLELRCMSVPALKEASTLHSQPSMSGSKKMFAATSVFRLAGKHIEVAE